MNDYLSIYNKIKYNFLRVSELEKASIYLKSDYKYREGCKFPEFEENLKNRQDLIAEIILIVDSDILSETEKEKLWDEFGDNIYTRDRQYITDDYTWTKIKSRSEEYRDKLEKKTQSNLLKPYIPDLTESDEDRIMRRLKEGNGDLEGF